MHDAWHERDLDADGRDNEGAAHANGAHCVWRVYPCENLLYKENGEENEK